MHVPVLVSEVLVLLQPRAYGVYLDGTLGAGGYTEAILQASSPTGAVVGLDLDRGAVERSRKRLSGYHGRFTAIHGGFQDAPRLLAAVGLDAVDGAVLDLGLSSDQLKSPERGFSFQSDGPLDMRFDPDSGDTVIECLSLLSLAKLEEILATYGEERYCRRLARGILEAVHRGQLRTTTDLAKLVNRIVRGRRGKIHPATRTFQALRIAVNRELDNLSTALNDIPALLAPEGRFCVVSYHSLEDRLVKHSFRDRRKSADHWNIVTPKPVRPSREESAYNPRARSARLRCLELLARPVGEHAGEEEGPDRS